MRSHRFIGNFDIKRGSFKLQDKELFNQFRNVLKLKIGEMVILCDGQMNEGEAEIKGYGKDIIDLEILSFRKNQNEQEKDVVLYCAVLKKENFELVVQKATEIGIKKIVPLITERTVKLNIRHDRLEKIIKEAAEQSGRGIVPVLHEPVDFKNAIKNIGNNGENILFDISGDQFPSHTTSYLLLHATLWIGPEGGWTREDLDLAREADFKIINLGKLTLRAETAAIVGSYLVVHNS